MELAALVLEGRTFAEAVEDAEKTWAGSLEDEHRRALILPDNELMLACYVAWTYPGEYAGKTAWSKRT